MLYEVHLVLLPKRNKTFVREKFVKVLKSICFVVMSWYNSVKVRDHTDTMAICAFDLFFLFWLAYLEHFEVHFCENVIIFSSNFIPFH